MKANIRGKNPIPDLLKIFDPGDASSITILKRSKPEHVSNSKPLADAFGKGTYRDRI